MILFSEVVTNKWQIEQVRKIYNENLNNLATLPLPHRSYDDQQIWWKENKDKIKVYVYRLNNENDSEIIAFSMLTLRGSFVTPIIAVRKKYWGKGVGKELIKDYIEKANMPLAGSQLKSNTVICYLNMKFGWEVIGEAGEGDMKIQLLYHSGMNNMDKEGKIKKEILKYLEDKYK